VLRKSGEKIQTYQFQMSVQLCQCGTAHAASLRFRRRVSRCVLAQPASSSDHHSKYVTYIHRSVGPNERVESGGCIVIHGSVEEGARITSAGDVMVWGR
jgi:septum formation inhibitor MinC